MLNDSVLIIDIIDIVAFLSIFDHGEKLQKKEWQGTSPYVIRNAVNENCTKDSGTKKMLPSLIYKGKHSEIT